MANFLLGKRTIVAARARASVDVGQAALAAAGRMAPRDDGSVVFLPQSVAVAADGMTGHFPGIFRASVIHDGWQRGWRCHLHEMLFAAAQIRHKTGRNKTYHI